MNDGTAHCIGMILIYVGIFAVMAGSLVTIIWVELAVVILVSGGILCMTSMIIGTAYGGLGWEYVPEDVRKRQIED